MSSETSLPCLVQNKPSGPIRRVENKVEFLERQFHSEKLSFVHKKETEHSFELTLSLLFYRCIFNLEMQNFSLENHHMMNGASHFDDRWHLLVPNPFLSLPLKWLTWPLDVCGGGGYGWFYWFSLGKNFFSNLSGVRNFFPDIRFFFSQHYTSWAIFFSVQDIIFPRNLFACFFPVEVNLEEIFLKSPITPSKVKWSAPKIQQTFGQLTDSDLSIISKGFWNNRGQTL